MFGVSKQKVTIWGLVSEDLPVRFWRHPSSCHCFLSCFCSTFHRTVLCLFGQAWSSNNLLYPAVLETSGHSMLRLIIRRRELECSLFAGGEKGGGWGWWWSSRYNGLYSRGWHQPGLMFPTSPPFSFRNWIKTFVSSFAPSPWIKFDGSSNVQESLVIDHFQHYNYELQLSFPNFFTVCTTLFLQLVMCNSWLPHILAQCKSYRPFPF